MTLSMSEGFFLKLYPMFTIAKKFLAEAEGKYFLRFTGMERTTGSPFNLLGMVSAIAQMSVEAKYPVSVVFLLWASFNAPWRSMWPVMTLILSSGK